MNAYELADELSKYTIDDGVDDLNKKTINMLRQQADRIAELEKEVDELWDYKISYENLDSGKN